MSHRNARLNVRGRQLLVERVCEQGWAVAHAERLQLTAVRFTDWAWTPQDGWSQTGEPVADLQLQLAT